jgi:NAD-dependent deacetylase
MSIDWSAHDRVVVLTGAGISVASGLRPYRGAGGLWEEMDASEVADAKALVQSPDDVWAFFAEARAQARAAEPNAAHRALAAAEARLVAEGKRLTVITQNVDGLHQQAGSCNVIELHGSLARARCSNEACRLDSHLVEPHEARARRAPRCCYCNALLRPDVVLFGELLPAKPEWLAKRALRDCDLFIAVGTSGTVSPASSYVRSAAYAGAHTILVNLEPMDPPNPAFTEQLLGRAEELVPELLADLLSDAGAGAPS